MIYRAIWFILLIGMGGQAGEWRRAAPLNTPRHGAAAVALDGYIYMLGGATTNGITLNTVERYDPATQSWDEQAVPPFATPRLDAVAIGLNGKIYLIGGQDANGEIIKKVEEYDPLQNAWTEKGELRRERRGHAAAPVFGTICILTGIRDVNDYEVEIEWFNKSEEKWEAAQANWEISRFKPFVTAVNDVIYLFGGIFNVPTRDSFIGPVEPGWIITWENGPELTAARGNGATAVLGDSIVMIGGIDSYATATGTVEIYNLASSQLQTDAPPLLTPRISPAAAVLDGKIFVAGGYSTSPDQPLATVEVFVPTPTAIDPGENPLPAQFALLRGYPNPFNGVIQLEADIPRSAPHTLTIYNLRGQVVNSLFAGVLTAGVHRFWWDARNNAATPVSSGIYVSVLKSPNYLKKLKIIYIR